LQQINLVESTSEALRLSINHAQLVWLCRTFLFSTWWMGVGLVSRTAGFTSLSKVVIYGKFKGPTRKYWIVRYLWHFSHKTCLCISEVQLICFEARSALNVWRFNICVQTLCSKFVVKYIIILCLNVTRANKWETIILL